MSTTNDFETVPEASGDTTRDPCTRTALGLVVAWSAGDPIYQGAFVPVEEGTQLEFGRGNPKPTVTSTAKRAIAIRQRPAGAELLPAMSNPALSRVQLLLERRDGRLLVENCGRLPLRVNGATTSFAELELGDVVELGATLVLICVERPVRWPEASPDFSFGAPDRFGMVGESAAIWELRAALARSAEHRGHVLILGESGVGKELAARALHLCSRSPGALIARNAATIPEALVDAELFGNAKGYPNPGLPERPGLVGSADEGTLFLDEFGDLPEAAQAHLLRVLDSGEYHRLGESRARRSSFRLLAATSRSQDQLRTDLAARFEFVVKVPALGARPEDIPWLAAHLLREMTEDKPLLRARALAEGGQANLEPSFVACLLRHRFLGNTRELKQLLWRSLLAERAGALVWPQDDAGPTVATQERAAPATGSGEMLRAVTESGAPSQSAEPEAEFLHPSDPPPSTWPAPEQIQAALDANNGSLETTYRALGLSSRHALARLVRKHGLRVTRRTLGR